MLLRFTVWTKAKTLQCGRLQAHVTELTAKVSVFEKRRADPGPTATHRLGFFFSLSIPYDPIFP